MSTIALCGFSEKSWGPAFDLPEDIELWSCNHAYRVKVNGKEVGFPRIDRLFEMHRIEHIKDKNYYERKHRIRHIKYLERAEHPVVMLDHFDEFPASERFPIEDALRRYPHADFCSTFDYMMAYAILKVDTCKILLYGFEMDSDTEWAYQRPSAKEWIERARAAGIEVGGQSNLLEKRKLYGYEAAEMVSRQTLEAHRREYLKQLKENEMKLHIFEGRMAQLLESGNGNVDQKTAENYGAKIRQLTIAVAQSETGVVVCDNFIDVCDMKEVEPLLVREAV